MLLRVTLIDIERILVDENLHDDIVSSRTLLNSTGETKSKLKDSVRRGIMDGNWADLVKLGAYDLDN